ncbi:hypothetical protein [Cohnella sp. JJ-181]|uniref:hypothetical protein n=1 Tax=Cohnella rhizoplanae TaxID=2974897 RepID=UPI00232FFF8F|nr:hypothetical protein [Cohnella sp. JJ-181]
MRAIVFILCLLAVGGLLAVGIQWADKYSRYNHHPFINEAQYNSLEKGMTYEEVVDIMGGKPKKLSERDFGAYQKYTYFSGNWYDFRNYVAIYLYFDHGVLERVDLNGRFYGRFAEKG